MNKLILLSLSLITLLVGCKKKEVIPSELLHRNTTTSLINQSPCSNGLTDNKVVTSSSFPLTLNLTTTIGVWGGYDIIKGISSSGHSCTIRFGKSISAGIYPLVQAIPADSTEAAIEIRTNNGLVFLSTSGSLYVTDSASKFKIEFCDIIMNANLAGNLVSTSATGRMVANK